MTEETWEIVNLIETEVEVIANHQNAETENFCEQRKLFLHPNFLNIKDAKKQNITSHARWFKNKIKINHEKEEIEAINKRKICVVDFGMNIGTEINWQRPVVIYKSSTYKYWEDIVVIPITSFLDDEGNEKSQDALDIILEADPANWIDHKSLLKIRQIRCISKKRIKRDKKTWIIKIWWNIEDKNLRGEINGKIKVMFGLDGNDT